MENNFFEIEQLMGDGKTWSTVILDDETAPTPEVLQFESKDDAIKYIERNYRTPGTARIVGVRCTRTILSY